MIAAVVGLVTVIAVVMTANVLGHSWRRGVTGIGCAVALFLIAIVMDGIMILHSTNPELVREGLAPVATWLSALGWLLLFLGVVRTARSS